MDSTMQAEVFRVIEQRFQELGFECMQVEGGPHQLGNTIRALIPVTDRGETVLMEVMLAKLTEETGLIQFYTTMIMEIEQGYDELLKANEYINFFCPLGAFGIFPDEKQYFHKYTLVYDNEDSAQRLAQRALVACDLIYGAISQHFPLVAEFTQGQLTYEQAIEKGYLIPKDTEE